MTDTNEPINPYLAKNDPNTENRWGGQSSVPPAEPAYAQYQQPAVSPPYAQQTSPYGYQQPYSGYTPQPKNTLAIVSLIAGIAGIVFLGFIASIPAVITGHMALNQLKINPAQEGRGFAIAGLVMGYIVTGLTVLGILFFILIFGLSAASGSSGY